MFVIDFPYLPDSCFGIAVGTGVGGTATKIFQCDDSVLSRTPRIYQATLRSLNRMMVCRVVPSCRAILATGIQAFSHCVA